MMTTVKTIALVAALAVVLQVGSLWHSRSQRQALAARASVILTAPPGAVLSLAGLPIVGSASADLVVVEFSDYECQYCARHATDVLKRLFDQFVANGRIRYAVASAPLPSHPSATLLAKGALCAGYQDRFWEVHDLLFTAQPRTREALLEVTTETGVDTASLARCLDHGQASTQLETDRAAALRLGLARRPSFLIGREKEPGVLTAERLIIGAQSLEVFAEVLEEIQ